MMLNQTSAVQPVGVEQCGAASLIWIDNPPVNALSSHVIHGLFAALTESLADPSTQVVVILGCGKAFSGGADITEFGTTEDPPTWADLMRVLDAAEKPVIAALHGFALGGGLELALACSHRVAMTGTQIGLPEINLGLIPGGGGTQRLPRLIGMADALDLILSGKRIDAIQASHLGLLDAVFKGNLAEEAKRFGVDRAEAGQLPHAFLTLADATTPQAIAAIAKATSRTGRSARTLAIEAVLQSSRLPLPQGLAHEAQLFADCVASPDHANLSYLFFAERKAARWPQTPADMRRIRRVGVIGGGTMGQGIALTLIAAGIDVALVEQDSNRLDQALSGCRRHIESSTRRGRVTPDEASAQQNRLTGCDQIANLGPCDLVIEAVFEDLDLKRRILSELDTTQSASALLASNTSALNLDTIAQATGRRDRVLGLHFFSPANVMTLLEIVRGTATSADTIAIALRFAREIGKQPVVAGVCDGFVANRMFDPYFREADFLVEEGASPYEVDTALLAYGMPMGPFAVADLVGLDVGQSIRKRQRAALPTGHRFSTLEDHVVAFGRLGRKNGQGWYRYSSEGTREPDEKILALVRDYRARSGITPRTICADEIRRRCLDAVVLESARLIEDGMVQRASDIDVAAVHGYGFPRHLGGPLKQADTEGLDNLVRRIEGYADRFGTWWSPSPLLAQLAQHKTKLVEVVAESFPGRWPE